jgi:hypothetical protein
MWWVSCVAMVLKPSYLSVQLLPSRQTFTQSWIHTPLVDLHADVDTPRFCVSVADRAFWFHVHLYPCVVEKARTTEALQAALEVELSPTQAIGRVVPSSDVAEALQSLEVFGLESRLTGHCVALGVDRVRSDRNVTLALARICLTRALSRLGA